MARDWEATFSTWTERASDSEQTRYENTCKAIKEALDSPSLDRYAFTVYSKGSYPAFTNVVRDSDVDIAVELTTLYKYEFIHGAKGSTLADVGGYPYTGDVTLADFKDSVERVLVDHFGRGAVDRGNKAIHLREGSRSLKADVVPCVTYKAWSDVTSAPSVGIRLLDDSDPGKKIQNYPDQHIKRGTEKNDRCQRRYKRVVRILKRLENEMVDKGVIEAVPSFAIESAVSNVPDTLLSDETKWMDSTENALLHIFGGTQNDECVGSNDWLEANRIKYLFHSEQPWTREQINAFVVAAWGYVGFE